MTKPVVIVGASMGGLRAAESLRRFGYAGPIVAIGDEPYPPYNRPPLSKEVLANEVSLEAVAFPQRAATADVDWRLGEAVVACDLAAGWVELAAGDRVEYSQLIIATGLRAQRQQYPNDLEFGRHVIRNLDDAIALRAALRPGARVVILGAGFIGCESAATAVKLGAEVTVVTPHRLPILRPLGEQFAGEILRRHLEQGTRFELGQRVVDLLGESRVEGVVLSDGRHLACDVFIEAIGSQPNVEWLFGQDLDLTDGVLCDSGLRAVRGAGGIWPNVFAVGDVARFANPLFDEQPRRVEHWNIPTESAKFVGAAVARALAGEQGEGVAGASMGDETVFAPLPSFWSDQFEMHILAFGLPGLATEQRLVAGELADEFIVEYWRQDRLVGVAGMGMRSQVQGYRRTFAGEGLTVGKE